jgi:hypothetical protein
MLTLANGLLREVRIVCDPTKAGVFDELMSQSPQTCSELLLGDLDFTKRACAQADVVRPPWPWNRSILAEIYLCHACSCHETLRIWKRPGRWRTTRRCAPPRCSAACRRQASAPSTWPTPSTRTRRTTSRRCRGCGRSLAPATRRCRRAPARASPLPLPPRPRTRRTTKSRALASAPPRPPTQSQRESPVARKVTAAPRRLVLNGQKRRWAAPPRRAAARTRTWTCSGARGGVRVLIG